MPWEGSAEERKEKEGHEGDPWAILSTGSQQKPLHTQSHGGGTSGANLCTAEMAKACTGLGVRDLGSSPGPAASWLPGHFLCCGMGM